MNRHLVNYMAQDSWQGVKRNPGSSIASVFLVALALLLFGLLLSARLFASDAIDYIETQLSMKVYVSDMLEVEEVAEVLAEQDFIEEMTIETGSESLENLAFFFNGNEQLLEAFGEGVMLDAIKLQVSDKDELAGIATELAAIEGIEKVVYPQQMAVALDSWITLLERFGILAAIVFFGIAFGMVYFTFHLAMYKRQQEIAVKLFVGMNPKALKAQFLMEGALLGLGGAALAIPLTAGFLWGVLKPVQQALPFTGQLEAEAIALVLLLQLAFGLLLAVSASLLSTRKGIANG